MWKRIEVLAVVVGMLGLATGIGLKFYHGDFPREPNAARGRIVPENYHGVYVFLTRDEARFESMCLWLGGVAAIVAAAIDVYKDPYRRRDRRKGSRRSG